jgi:hypothetical protein
VVWTSPLIATFTPGAGKSYPSGSRHPLNAVEDEPRLGSDFEFSLVDGETVTTKCTLKLDTTMDCLKAKVDAVRFKVRMIFVLTCVASLCYLN